MEKYYHKLLKNYMFTTWSCYVVVIILVNLISCFCEEKSIYLVLVEGDPLAFLGERSKLDFNSEVSKTNAKELVEYHDKLLETNLENGTYKKIYSFNHIINGFAVHTTPSQAKLLHSIDGVKRVERDRGAKLMTTYTPQFLGLPQAVWSSSPGGNKNLAGQGIVIGFIDTGINPLHPSFAYDGGAYDTSNSSRFLGACDTGPAFPATSCNGKIVSARYFSAGAQALNASLDYQSPFDEVGHGSHVAATAAGNAGVPVVANGFYYGKASGMAPRARIAVYKAVYATVGTLADVLAAIDQATMDGVDVLTLSVGPDEPPEDTITLLSVFDISLLFARKAGIFVVQAAGNHGPDYLTVLSYSPWAVGVGACTTDRAYHGSLLLGNGQKVTGVGLSGPTLGDGLFLYKLVAAKDAIKVDGTFPRTPQYNEECQRPEAFDSNVVRDSVVICTFSVGFYNGSSSIDAIIHTATSLGFMGFAFLANPAYGDFIAEPIPFPIPGIMVPKADDAKIVSEYYEEQTKRDEKGIVIEFQARGAVGEGRVASFDERAPIVSRFSSRGPDFLDIARNPVDVLKPDIVAPGHQIWAAWSPLSALEPVLSGQNFALMSGTSMATPHVAGIAALIKQHCPSWSPSMIASAISTTATKYDNHGEVILAEGTYIDSYYHSTHFDLGAGLVNPCHAIDPGLVFSSEFEDYIRFLCSLPNIDWNTIKATTGAQCMEPLEHPADLNLPSVTVSRLKDSQTVRRRVKSVSTERETYVCAVISPNGTIVTMSPTWFTIAPQGTQELEIEFSVMNATNEYSFGEIVLTGSLNHVVRIPLSVLPVSLT